MKIRLCVAIALSLVFSVSAAAQEHSKAEVFGGYQFARLDGGTNLNGWNGDLTGNFNKHFGMTADFSGNYGSGGSMYTYTFGPNLSGRVGAAKPFVHALFGGVRLGDSRISTTGIGMMFGGGLDVGRGRLAWRAVQADWLIARFSGFTDKKNARVSTGLVFRF